MSGIVKIPLTQGQYAIIDASDHLLVKKYKWRATKDRNTYYTYYAKALGGGRSFRVRMHRVILNAPEGVSVDHIDHNGLNNTRSNIRLCTHAQNMANKSPNRSGTSPYKGVCWVAARNLWIARIEKGAKCLYLGQFHDEKEAAKAYDRKALELFGEFAFVNFQEVQR